MSANDELLVDRTNYKGKDWKADLKRFAARAIETTLQSSKKKRNRRYGIMYPGVIKEELLHIGVALDTSGSISEETLYQFMAEVANISKYATVTVVEADSEVKNAYLFDPKKTYKIKGRGGTAYQPAFDYFTKETDVDGVIYFGDMDNFEERLTKPKYPVLWAIVGDQKPPAEWGAQTKVEVVRK
jgi:predicted metal-dependent peptidase